MPSPKPSIHAFQNKKVGGGRGSCTAVVIFLCILCTSILCYTTFKGGPSIARTHSMSVPQLINALNAKLDNTSREEEVRKVVFIKLIKVAGTTVQYVLHNYAERSSLKIAELREPGEEEVPGMVRSSYKRKNHHDLCSLRLAKVDWMKAYNYISFKDKICFFKESFRMDRLLF